VRIVAFVGLVFSCGSCAGNANVPRRTVSEAICHVGEISDACRIYFQGQCDHESLLRRSPRGGFTEGACGAGRFITEPAHPEGEFRDYFFDASGALVGMRWCGDMNSPCPSTALTKTQVCQGWGGVPRCTMITESVHDGD
jgi:hypothetical protein